MLLVFLNLVKLCRDPATGRGMTCSKGFGSLQQQLFFLLFSNIQEAAFTLKTILKYDPGSRWVIVTYKKLPGLTCKALTSDRSPL